MGRTRDENLVEDSAPPEPKRSEGELGDPIPDSWCRLCWHEHLVWRGSAWMLEHRGPLDTCIHDCHDGDQLLPSVS
jgi:hypothetical protein